MQRILIYILIGLTYSALPLLKPLEPEKVLEPKKSLAPAVQAKKVVHKKKEVNTVPKKFSASNSIALKKVSFDQLPGWDKADVKKSFSAFQRSCKTNERPY